MKRPAPPYCEPINCPKSTRRSLAAIPYVVRSIIDALAGRILLPPHGR